MSESLATKGFVAGLVVQVEEGVPFVEEVVASAGQLRLRFNLPCALTANGGAINLWSIDGGPCAVRGVSFDMPATVVLGVTEQLTGSDYHVNVPAAVVQSPTGAVNLPATLPFTGVGQSPTIYVGERESGTSVLVTFSEPVEATSALNVGHYGFSPPLLILRVEQVDSRTFRLVTARQAPATIYTVTVSGVLDLAGNPI